MCAVFFLTHALSGQDIVATAPTHSTEDGGLRRFELGGQAIDLRIANNVVCPPYDSRCPLPQEGLGIGGAFNFNSHLALDTNINVLPRSIVEETFVFNNGAQEGGRASEFLTGIRAETRARRYGFFLDAGTGFISWSQVPTGEVLVPAPDGMVLSVSYTRARRVFFTSKVGAGFEYSPAARIHVRLDVGDLTIRYGHSTYATCGSCVKNTPQVTAGIYAGLGRPISWQPPAYDARTLHRFWRNDNLALMGVSLLGITADAITTQRFISRGLLEGDPFARPFVKYGWSGQVALSGVEMTGIVFAMYGLHRAHQHWVERLLPVSVGTVHGIFAYNNLKYLDRHASK